MKKKLGPCPSCQRHVFVSDERCPFCGAAWTRRGFLSAAAVLIAAPIADAFGMVQETKYGGPRELTERALERSWVWTRLGSNWRVEFALSRIAESWASHKAGTKVTYKSKGPQKIGKKDSITTTWTLRKITDKDVTLFSEPMESDKGEERTLSRSTDLPAGTKVEEGSAETVEVDGKKFKCDVKTYTNGARVIKVWLCKDAPFGVVKTVYGQETGQLIKLSDELTVGGKKYSCALWETVNGTLTIREWRSTDVPGLVVKYEEMTKSDPKQPAQVTLSVELTSVTEGK